MKATEKKFLQDLSRFSRESIQWCVQESETATGSMGQAMDVILRDTARVSKLSEESLQAIKDLKQHFSQTSAPDYKSLVGRLQKTCAGNHEMKQLVEPLMQTLQFQDFFRQQLENLQKMLELWVEERERVANGALFDAAAQKALGERFLQHTTMATERDILRRHFDGLEHTDGGIEPVQFF